MPFQNFEAYTFSRVSVDKHAPLSSGIYGLSNSREWIYIGETEDIQAALLAHMQDPRAALMKRAPTGFVFEICAGPRRPVRQEADLKLPAMRQNWPSRRACLPPTPH